MTTLPGGPDAPALARAALADRFGDGVDPDAAATLKLLSSEVVTNCVQHARADAGAPIELRAWMLSGCVHVEVSTDSPPFRRASDAGCSSSTSSRTAGASSTT